MHELSPTGLPEDSEQPRHFSLSQYPHLASTTEPPTIEISGDGDMPTNPPEGFTYVQMLVDPTYGAPCLMQTYWWDAERATHSENPAAETYQFEAATVVYDTADGLPVLVSPDKTTCSFLLADASLFLLRVAKDERGWRGPLQAANADRTEARS